MPDLWMDVDTALSEVPVNLLPLLDDTDFKTIETDVNFDATGLSLIWHFVTTAGAYTQTAVTPTNTGGNYDWVEQGNGLFTIEIPASGGASINNDTEGFGWFTGKATGVLPWRGPVIGFRASGLNDLLIDSAYSTTRGLAGTALPAVAAEASGGLYTRGSGAGQINQAANGQVDVNTVAAGGTTWSTAINSALDTHDGPDLPTGVVATDGGNSASAFKTDRTEAANDYWKDALLLITSGVLIGQVKKITAYDGTNKIVTLASALTGTPADGVSFALVNR